MASERTGAGRDEAMGGLAKGLSIIEGFTAGRERMTLTAAAAAADATPAAARRCLRTLEELGYVSYDGKFYSPNPRLMRLGAAYSQTSPLPVLAQPRLIAARDQLDESISLAVLEDDAAVFVARADAHRIVSAGVRVGAQLPAHASATGRVLLATLGDEELDRHLRGCRPQRTTTNTLTTVAEIRDRVRLAREEGYAYTDEELELGVRTMAVPVRDVDGSTHAAMSVSAFAARVSVDEMRSAFLPTLHLEARRLGRML